MPRALGFAQTGDTIVMMPGSYAPFSVIRPSITITAQAGATVYGAAAARDAVYVGASGVHITGLDVQGCVPNARPGAGIDLGASAGIRVGPGTDAVVLDGVTVRNSHSTTPEGLPFGCHGIEFQSSTNGTVTNSNIFHNGDGISAYGGSNLTLTNNNVHDNDVLYKNTLAPGDDTGGTGIAVNNVAGATIANNTIVNNGGVSHDYKFTGGALSNWQSSSIKMTGNTLTNNYSALTTGASGTADCLNNTFTANTVTGRITNSPFPLSIGLRLQCAHNMVVSGNTLTGLDWWTFWIFQKQPDGSNGGSIQGLSITGNTVAQNLDQIYALGALPTTNPITINTNNYTFHGAFGTPPNSPQLRTLATWRTATGFDTTALAVVMPANPTTWYVSGAGSDKNSGLTSSSPFRAMARTLASAKAGDTVVMMAGSYAPFVVTQPGLTLTAQPGATVYGTASARDVVLVDAPNVTVRGLNIQGCLPNANPYGGINFGASAGLRVAPGTSGVTLDSLTVGNSHGVTPEGLPFGCYGVNFDNATNSTITNSDIYHNGEGISVSGAGTGITIQGNKVHDNDVIMKNTATSSVDDWGGVGISAGDAVGVTITKNSIFNNGGPSHDWGTDGGALEIYESSNVVMSYNTIYNNVNVLETGAGGTNDCKNNSFTGNIASGLGPNSRFTTSVGLLLRCANGMVVSNNSLSQFDWWTFWVYQRQTNGSNGGTINGLSITSNTVTQSTGQVYSVGLGANATTIAVNNNFYSYFGTFATVSSGQSAGTLANWRLNTGFDATLLAAPAAPAANTAAASGSGPAPAAATWYVSGSGSDGNTGRSATSAFRAMPRALGFAQTGDTIVMMPGSYAPFSVIRPSITITAQAGATVYGAAAARDAVYVGASGVHITGLDVQGCVPNARPGAGIDLGASAGIRVGPGTDAVVLDGVTVRNSHSTTPEGLPFGCHGIEFQSSTNGTVTNSNIFHNGDGISAYGGSNLTLTNNNVHDNDVLYKNTLAPGDDTGGTGIAVNNVAGATIANNTIVNNGGVSHDYKFTGGALSNWQSSSIKMTGNTLTNNYSALTTGASGTADCLNNTFTANTVTGRITNSPFPLSIGLRLQCAHNMVVSGNTLTGLDWWTFWIFQKQPDGSNGGSIQGLSITGNTVAQNLDQIYALGALPTTNPITINTNNYTFHGAFGTPPNSPQLRTLATWRTATGFDTF